MTSFYGGTVVVVTREDEPNLPKTAVRLRHLTTTPLKALEKANVVLLIERDGDATPLKDRFNPEAPDDVR